MARDFFIRPTMYELERLISDSAIRMFGHCSCFCDEHNRRRLSRYQFILFSSFLNLKNYSLEFSCFINMELQNWFSVILKRSIYFRKATEIWNDCTLTRISWYIKVRSIGSSTYLIQIPTVSLISDSLTIVWCITKFSALEARQTLSLIVILN